jgi:hypothetical protein
MLSAPSPFALSSFRFRDPLRLTPGIPPGSPHANPKARDLLRFPFSRYVNPALIFSHSGGMASHNLIAAAMLLP